MAGFVFTPAAEADIEGIWDYTAEHWNIDQADRYIDDIRDACRGLADGRKRGQKVAIRAGYMKFAVGTHLLFYRAEDGVIVIVRILHRRMDAEAHLN